ncbi:hypothetical protein [Caenimonas sedimenti]|uniref:hypothetical protein n=1 Tax=Caenimonas sedimenti TaxID=2596921 RepID=UPI0016482745|nr:hypothetical protein [Caenimonas sedimenti]
MLDFFAQIARFLSPAAPDGADFPNTLLEEAGARAGRDPQQAQELRDAAHAAMRVVR